MTGKRRRIWASRSIITRSDGDRVRPPRDDQAIGSTESVEKIRCVARWLLVVPLLLFSGGIAIGADCRPATDADLEKLRSELEMALVDAPAARFRDICVYEFARQIDPQKTQQMRTYCGYINSKNKAGGYTGYSRFYYAEGTGSPGILSESKRSGDLMMFYVIECMHCRQLRAKVCAELVENAGRRKK